MARSGGVPVCLLQAKEQSSHTVHAHTANGSNCLATLAVSARLSQSVCMMG